MRIGVDLDGCAYDFTEALRTWLFKNNVFTMEEMPDPVGWNFFEDQWNMTLDDFIHHCGQGVDAEHIFLHGEPIEESAIYINELKGDGHTIHIATARSYGQKSAANTEAWLKLWDIPYDSLTLGNDKTLLNVDIMIDDRDKNYLQLVEAGIKTYLLDRPWNQDLATDDRIYSWKEFYEKVNKYSDDRTYR